MCAEDSTFTVIHKRRLSPPSVAWTGKESILSLCSSFPMVFRGTRPIIAGEGGRSIAYFLLFNFTFEIGI